MPPTIKPSVNAIAPFPRSTWIHPRVPNDQFDRVCKAIWIRAMKVKEELDRYQRSAERQNKDCKVSDINISRRAEEQQNETDALSLSKQCEEYKQQHHTDFTLPCPHLWGRRDPRVAEPEDDTEDKKRSFRNIWVPQSVGTSDKQNAARVLPFTAVRKFKPQPPATNPPCSASEDPAPHLPNKTDHPALPSEQLQDTCASKDEQDTTGSSYSTSSDEDFVTLPGLRRCATDSSDDDSASDVRDTEEDKNEIPHSLDELSSDSRQDSPSSSSEEDFPALSTIKVGILPHPMAVPASGKMQGQWEIPLSFHPHVIPTATLASGVTAPATATVQSKAKTPHTKLITNRPPAAPKQQEAYDLLADFPALQAPKKLLALGKIPNGTRNGKTREEKRGLTHSPNHCQESGATDQRRMENVPHEISSICAGDQKSVLDLQTFGPSSRLNAPTISCEIPKANNLPPPKGTDGAGVNARSWACAAKAGMKRAAAPQEKARPCTFQQIVTINRAKAVHSVTHNIPNKVNPSYQATGPLVNAWCRGPRTHNPKSFVRSGYPPTHQHFGTQAHRAKCPPGLGCPRFPFQQARGNRAKCDISHCDVK
ncbi:hypothetical protein PAMA_011370 [Pampus argenteus]